MLKRLSKKNSWRLVLSGFFIVLLIYSSIQIFFWQNDNKKLEKIKQEIDKKVKIEELEIMETEEENILVNQPNNSEDIYWQYKDVSLIDVNIEELKAENDDTIGWIQVSGTNINYPVVQSSDNDYYLKRDFTKEKNKGGWIFLDYRNKINNLSKNNIIYGHRRYNKSMFGTLKNVLTNSWQQNPDNHIIKISTTEYNYLFQVFSVYQIPYETYYLQTDFTSNGSYLDFLNTILSRSEYNFNTEVNAETIILTLSTCHNKEDRLVVHSKLIKANQK